MEKHPGGSLMLSALAAFFPLAAQAQTTYYVSTTGSDGNNGTSLNTPFATIGKAAAVIKAGERCLIRQGIYRETVKPANSGTSGAPISFEAYGSDLVYISGADPVTGWTQHSGNIYKANMPWNLGIYHNQIIVDGKMAWNARTPNVDDPKSPDMLWCGGGFGVVDRRRWHTLAEPVATSQRVCFGATNDAGYGQVGSSYDHTVSNGGDMPAALFNHPNDFFKGGLLTIQAGYWIGTALISGSTSTSSTTNITAGRINPMSQQNGGGPGWISHVFALLDAPNEWYRDSTTQTLYLWVPGGGNPSSHLVEAKRRTLGFDLTGKQYINLRKLRVIAASLTTKDAQRCCIEDCQFKYVTHDDVPMPDELGVSWEIQQNVGDGHLGIYLGGSNNVLRKCLVRGSANSGVVIGGNFDTVTNCRISSCDYSVTYHGGVLIVPDNGDWSDANRPRGARVLHSYFAFNNRASVQVGCAYNNTAGAKGEDGIKIMYNEFATSSYLSETGQVAMQSSQGGDLSYNVFHDAAFIDVGSTCLEEDFGATNWKVHHNVFYQGDSSVVMSPGGPVVMRCCDFTFSYYGGEESMCFNNTVIDTVWEPLRAGWQYMLDDNGQPWPTPVNRNNLWAKSDTAPWKFTNPRKRDYTLTALSTKAIDKGVVIPGWVDTYKGVAPDLGAYEYGDTPWVAGPDWQEQAWVYPPPSALIAEPIDRQTGGPMLRPIVRPWRKAILICGLDNAEYRVTVFNAAGVPVVVQRGSGSRAISIDAAGFAPGIYVVRLFSGGRTVTEKALVR